MSFGKCGVQTTEDADDLEIAKSVCAGDQIYGNRAPVYWTARYKATNINFVLANLTLRITFNNLHHVNQSISPSHYHGHGNLSKFTTEANAPACPECRSWAEPNLRGERGMPRQVTALKINGGTESPGWHALI